MATEQVQTQYLNATALEIFASTGDRMEQVQPTTGKESLTIQEFVQAQLAEAKIAQESTNQKALTYLMDQECTVAGTDRVITNCIKINSGYFYIDIRNGIISFVFEIDNKRISDGKSLNGRPNSREEKNLVERLKEEVARMGDLKSV